MEATITIPTLYLKKVIGLNLTNISRLEKTYNVNILYDKSKVNDYCYPLSE